MFNRVVVGIASNRDALARKLILQKRLLLIPLRIKEGFRLSVCRIDCLLIQQLRTGIENAGRSGVEIDRVRCYRASEIPRRAESGIYEITFLVEYLLTSRAESRVLRICGDASS